MVVEPPAPDVLRHPVRLEHLAQDRQAAIELPAHDAMRAVRDRERSPAVGGACAEVLGGVLVLEALHAPAVRSGEEEADHQVVEASVDELVDDRAESRRAPDPVEVGHARSMPPIRSPGEPGLCYHRRARRPDGESRMNSLPDPDRARRNAGLTLFFVGILVGGLLLVSLFVGIPLASGQLGLLGHMCLGAALAFPAGTMYLTVPRLLDRYDPEPWYALVGCLLWGGIAACGFSAVINTAVAELVGAVFGESAGEIVSTVVSAPLVEELWKAMGVLGVFYFLRREFDGVVDGIIYATFVALGFATVENVIYYARASSSDALAVTFVIRGIIAPWGHPVYTSMTGIGFGLSRETEKAWVRWLAPPIGYAGAVILHAMWNGSATLADRLGEGSGGMLFVCMLPVWLLFVTAFLLVVVLLVRRRGRIIRAFLEDEVAIRTLSREEVDLVCSAFGLVKARLRYGPKGVELVRAAARLALSKWHSVRAQNQRTRTVSMDFIVPLRQRIHALRAELARAPR